MYSPNGCTRRLSARSTTPTPGSQTSAELLVVRPSGFCSTAPTRIGTSTACGGPFDLGGGVGVAQRVDVRGVLRPDHEVRAWPACPRRRRRRAAAVSFTWLSSTARRWALKSRPRRGTLPCTAAIVTVVPGPPESGGTRAASGPAARAATPMTSGTTRARGPGGRAERSRRSVRSVGRDGRRSPSRPARRRRGAPASPPACEPPDDRAARQLAEREPGQHGDERQQRLAADGRDVAAAARRAGRSRRGPTAARPTARAPAAPRSPPRPPPTTPGRRAAARRAPCPRPPSPTNSDSSTDERHPRHRADQRADPREQRQQEPHAEQERRSRSRPGRGGRRRARRAGRARAARATRTAAGRKLDVQQHARPDRRGGPRQRRRPKACGDAGAPERDRRSVRPRPEPTACADRPRPPPSPHRAAARLAAGRHSRAAAARAREPTAAVGPRAAIDRPCRSRRRSAGRRGQWWAAAKMWALPRRVEHAGRAGAAEPLQAVGVGEAVDGHVGLGDLARVRGDRRPLGRQLRGRPGDRERDLRGHPAERHGGRAGGAVHEVPVAGADVQVLAVHRHPVRAHPEQLGGGGADAERRAVVGMAVDALLVVVHDRRGALGGGDARHGGGQAQRVGRGERPRVACRSSQPGRPESRHPSSASRATPSSSAACLQLGDAPLGDGLADPQRHPGPAQLPRRGDDEHGARPGVGEAAQRDAR